jgi:hypothetical protein
MIPLGSTYYSESTGESASWFSPEEMAYMAERNTWRKEMIDPEFDNAAVKLWHDLDATGFDGDSRVVAFAREIRRRAEASRLLRFGVLTAREVRQWHFDPRTGAAQELNRDPYQQVIYALERQVAALDAQAEALGAEGDYSAEFPAHDADRLREAILGLAQLERVKAHALEQVNERDKKIVELRELLRELRVGLTALYSMSQEGRAYLAKMDLVLARRP